ncbi:hypothetical protein FKM82_006498 [Ascaphus truei]
MTALVALEIRGSLTPATSHRLEAEATRYSRTHCNRSLIPAGQCEIKLPSRLHIYKYNVRFKLHVNISTVKHCGSNQHSPP